MALVRLFFIGTFVLTLFAPVVQAQSTAQTILERNPVSRKKFNKVVKILIDTTRRTKQLEEQVIIMQDKLRQAQGKNTLPDRVSPPYDVPSTDDSVVDLEKLDKAKDTRYHSTYPHYEREGLAPRFGFMFDFYLSSQPGQGLNGGDGFTFRNLHTLFLVDIIPTPDIQFTTEIRTDPRFFELDYQLTEWLQIRLGKIWVAFDDLNPHSAFGGRINASKLRLPNGAAYLPDLWADLGVGFKLGLYERTRLTVTGHIYMVNGFSEGGVDPLAESTTYPDYSDVSVEATDNNRAKSFGARVHFLINRTIGLGASVYTGRYNDQGDAIGLSTQLVGFDGQLYVDRFRLRTGFSFMNAELPATSTITKFSRPASYGELAYHLGLKRNYVFVFRVGKVDNDDRVVDINDQTIVGGKFYYRYKNIEWGAQYSRDLQTDIAAKGNKSFAALRVIAHF